MIRINFYIENYLFNQLKELPGTISEHVRIAIREYLVKVKEFNASASNQIERRIILMNEEVIEGEFSTPLPRKQGQSLTMDFIDAMRKIKDSQKVRRISWEDQDYCLMKDGWLTIYTKNAFHTWIVSDGDMDGQDWIVID